MTILIIILSIIGGLIALIFILALFAPREYDLEQQIIIDKPNSEVYNFIKYLKNMDQYGKWNMADPNMRKSYEGTDGTVGFKYSWDSDSKQVGTGNQTITKIDEGKEIASTLQFVKPFEGKAMSSIVTSPASGNSTLVKWKLHSGMSYPMNVMLILFDLRKGLTADLKQGLVNLKSILEK